MHKSISNLALGSFWVGFLLSILFSGFVWQVQADTAKPFLIDPAPTSVISDSGGSVQGAGKPTIKEVQSYLKVIYGKGWELAWKVSQNECSIKRPEWPNCLNSWAKERSIGMFQINLAKNEGRGAYVHWDKVPGKDLREKEVYLQNWKQNILISFVVSKGGTDFNPWTGYRMLNEN